LRSRVGVMGVVEDELVRFNLTTRIHDPGSYTIRLKVFERKQTDDKPLAEADFSLMLEEGQKQQRVVMEVPGVKMWSPDTPNVYTLIAELIDAEGDVSEIETRFGIRKIEARGAKVYLNNEPIYLDGILYQPGAATYEEIQKHMHAMKKLGCNLVRIHIAGVDPRIYNLADKIGLLLWVEVPSPHHSNHISRANHREELLRMLALIETHPSVIIWSLYNEDWGIQDVATNKETRDYIIQMYQYMHIYHPQFLVVDNDGWQHVSLEGRLQSDLLTAHLYKADLESWKSSLQKLVDGEINGVAAFPLVVGDPFFYRKQVPLLVSEWGGFGFADYGGPQSAEEQAKFIREYKAELRKLPIAGDVYTQATNIEEERNGLIDDTHSGLRVPDGILKSGAV
ncbi:MAG: glycoside hydrolase family 2, partial [Chitinophagaceae bacterium]